MYINLSYKKEPVRIPYAILKIVMAYECKQIDINKRLQLDNKITGYKKQLIKQRKRK